LPHWFESCNGSSCFFEQFAITLLLSTGWFQELILAWFDLLFVTFKLKLIKYALCDLTPILYEKHNYSYWCVSLKEFSTLDLIVYWANSVMASLL